MSLDNTLHPSTRGPEELVPSRYAVRVGDIDVLVVSDGVLPLPTKMLGHNADAATRATWLKDWSCHRIAFDWCRLNVVVVHQQQSDYTYRRWAELDPNSNLPRLGS